MANLIVKTKTKKKAKEKDATGLEPATLWLKTRCTDRLCYASLHIYLHIGFALLALKA